VMSTRGLRHAAMATTVVGLAFGALACSSGSGAPTGSGSGPSASSQSLASARNGSAPTLLAQCAISRHIAGAAASAEKYSGQLPAGQQWLHGGRIILTEVSGGQFTGWYEGQLAGVVVQGKSFDQWAQAAAASNKLPAALCGTAATASALYEQVYAQVPKLAKRNPWR
jgi:hypothetical protein